MDIRDYMVDILLTIILVVSTLVLVVRLWQDLIIAVAATLMMLSFGGLFISLGMKIRHLDENVISREHTMRVNLEEISTRMSQKYDATVAHIDEVVSELSRRMYR
jgi:predicted signal transduction protein with EAL and GGDEF domain